MLCLKLIWLLQLSRKCQHGTAASTSLFLICLCPVFKLYFCIHYIAMSSILLLKIHFESHYLLIGVFRALMVKMIIYITQTFFGLPWSLILTIFNSLPLFFLFHSFCLLHFPAISGINGTFMWFHFFPSLLPHELYFFLLYSVVAFKSAIYVYNQSTWFFK